MKTKVWLFSIIVGLVGLWGCGAARNNQTYHASADFTSPSVNFETHQESGGWTEGRESSVPLAIDVERLDERAEIQQISSAPEASFSGESNFPNAGQSKDRREESAMDVKNYRNSGNVNHDGWTERVVGEDELNSLNQQDPELSLSISRHILARLNVRAPYYIAQDIQNGRPLKVPNNFSRYKNWTPLPRDLPELSSLSKFILIAKDIPFLGWYENGRLVGDSHVCIGKDEAWTRAGIYRVRDKDIDHVSRSYTNAYGVPAPMPLALRIYEHVWIHAGDITGGNCSHGCINLPLMPAQELFNWADLGTVVAIVDRLNDLQTVIDSERSNCLLFAEQCDPARHRSG